MSTMYHFYGSAAEGIMNKEYLICFQLYQKAVIKNNDDRLFLRWCNGYQKQMSFNDFKERLLNDINKKDETAEEIYNKVEKILEGRYNG